MTDAKPDVGEIVARLNKSCRYAGTNNEHGSPVSACPGACREHAVMTEAARAILAQQAEIARLTSRVNELETKLTVDSLETVKALQAERDRLTQENARLAGEVECLSPTRDESCDTKGLTRPDKYCRMNRCEREEHGESRCNIMVAYKSLNEEARRDEQ